MLEFLKICWINRDPRCPYVFQRKTNQGYRRVKNIRTAIELAAARIGKPSLLFHDLRRTALRNMERAGIPRTVARQCSGHLTESAYLRYAGIASTGDAQFVAQRMTAHRQEQEAAAKAQEKLWEKLWESSELSDQKPPELIPTKLQQ